MVAQNQAGPSRAGVAPPAARARSGSFSWAWLGVMPFFIFTFMFLILPAGYLVIGAFLDSDGNLTLRNIENLFQPGILRSYLLSIQISAASAVLGALLGFFIAYAAVGGGLPKAVRSTLLTFSGVASNFAGVPLAFAFVATLGPTGLVTLFLADHFGISLRAAGFSLLSFTGLTLTYLYFQIPLMVLIITPALDGLKKEWKEASEILGASTWQYWRYIALPVLMPSLIGTTLLLFANSFGAIATAYALSTAFNLITVQLYAQIRGDVLHDQNLGYALALGMIIITGLSNGGYIWLRARGERWLR